MINAACLILSHFHSILADVFAECGHSEYWLKGGRGSTKSSFISVVIVLLVITFPWVNAVVFRRQANTLRDTVFGQILWAIGALRLDGCFYTSKSPLEIVYLRTGQKIIFRGLDDPKKRKGAVFPVGYCAVQWFEELDEFNGWDDISSTLRTYRRGGSRFWTFYSYNPPRSLWSWVNKKALEMQRKRGCVVDHSTYLDVIDGGHSDWLGEKFIEDAEYEKEEHPTGYRWEFLGEITGTGGSVFENVVQVSLTDKEIESFDNLRCGVDWGWFPDPWRFVMCEWQPARRRLVLFRELSANRTTPKDTGAMVREALTYRDARHDEPTYHRDAVWCDSAEPSSIDVYRRQCGLNARAADKGGMRRASYQWLEGLREIAIDPERCPRAWEEFTLCEYAKDRAGRWLDDYSDGNDHSIDAVRYAMMRECARGA